MQGLCTLFMLYTIGHIWLSIRSTLWLCFTCYILFRN